MKQMVFFGLVAVTLLVLLVGYGLNPPRIEAAEQGPNWYVNAEEFLDDMYGTKVEYVYGTGEAANNNAFMGKAKARIRAKFSLAQKVPSLLKLKAKTLDRFSQLGASGNNPTISELIEVEIEQLEAIKLPNVKVIKQGVSRDGRTYYALAIYFPKQTPKLTLITYGMGPVWRSALVPGWGQYHKRHKTKAWLFFASEVVLVPTALYMDWRGASERRKTSYPRAAIRDYHNERADQFYNISKAAWWIASGLYIYNLLDAGLTTGTRRYVADYKPIMHSPLVFNKETMGFMTIFHF